jgi:arginase
VNINLIGVPIYFGCDREGVEFGPEKLREKRVIDVIKKNNHHIYDCGNLYIPKVPKEQKFAFHRKMKYLSPIAEVNNNLAHQVYSALVAGSFPLVIGGDHSLGLGSISGASKFYKNLAVVWIDAHADINTDETSPSGNIHGMPLAAAMGIGSSDLTNVYYEGPKVKSENIFIIGARDIDSGETALIKEKNLNVYTAQDVKDRGIESIMEEINIKLMSKNIEAVHISFDIDSLDSQLVPGTGTPVSDGMTMDEVKHTLKSLMETKLVKSMDVAELNTLLDKDDVTAHIAIDIIDWAFKFA